MSKLQEKAYELPPLQKRILLALAVEGSQTINATKESIERDYKAVNTAFHSLEKNKLIERVGVKEYRNRKFDTFWLSSEGLILAIIHKVNLNILKHNYENLYGKSEDSDFLFEVAKNCPSMITMPYGAFKDMQKGKLTLRSFIPINGEDSEKFFKIMIKYPECRKVIKKAVKGIDKMLENEEKLQKKR